MRARTSPILHLPLPTPHPPFEIVNVENVAREVEQLELMPLPQQVHDHRPRQAEAVPELHGIRDTRLRKRFKGASYVGQTCVMVAPTTTTAAQGIGQDKQCIVTGTITVNSTIVSISNLIRSTSGTNTNTGISTSTMHRREWV